ncbi:MAG: flavin monoamine oxidase family protein [Gammaproteobacteria bacterium]
MSLHKGIDKFIGNAKVETQQSAPWQFQYPNTADFNFNYYQLLQNGAASGIAQAQPGLRCAIVGAGVAGLVAARELFRSGVTDIDIYEASDRIGGRNYSIPAAGQYTTFEMGAMRMPFFWPSGSNPSSWGPGSQACVLDYYCSLFGVTTQDFPDPGSTAVASTGIYMNNGLGPSVSGDPTLLIWNNPDGNTLPPSPELAQIYQLWEHFATMLTEAAAPLYGTAQWEPFWQALVQQYWTINFRELAYMPAISSYDPSQPGNFGGLGMNEQQAWDFYVIGAGDGGWGAFFDISALYPIRTLLFGFASHHQLVQGLFDNGSFNPGPHYQDQVTDNLGNPLPSPNYLGLQSVAESLLYQPVVSTQVNQMSLYDASKELPGINIYTQNPASAICRTGSTTTILSPAFAGGKQYDAVIVTSSTWALELNSMFQGYDQTTLPAAVQLSMKESHWITSCKVFYPLKERYWEAANPNGDPIPQVINTDTYLQDVYGMAVTVGERQDPGVLLVSYTWEDDAAKFEANQDDAALAAMCLQKLDSILLSCSNINTTISQFVDTSTPVVIHWEQQPSYRGCAKLYRERSWNLDYSLLSYNQQYSATSGLYFAGEGYSVEGGWTEPALRLALDAVINVLQNTGATFLNGFTYADYPQYSSWAPTSAT